LQRGRLTRLVPFARDQENPQLRLVPVLVAGHEVGEQQREPRRLRAQPPDVDAARFVGQRLQAQPTGLVGVEHDDAAPQTDRLAERPAVPELRAPRRLRAAQPVDGHEVRADRPHAPTLHHARERVAKLGRRDGQGIRVEAVFLDLGAQ
jgi:hypothetical protein